MNPFANFTQTSSDNVSPGLFTTEFVLSAVTMLLTLTDVFGSYHFSGQQKGAILAAVPIVYVLCRSVVKAVASMNPVARPVVPPTPLPAVPVGPGPTPPPGDWPKPA